MKYLDEFRDRKLTAKLADRIHRIVDAHSEYRYMEVCGTHTMSIFKFGLRGLLPRNMTLISGPGCPVCVTPDNYLDQAIAIGRSPNVIIATFGDIMRVRGSSSSLEDERADGRSVKTVYSTDDALDIARRNPDKEIVFLGIGFETTAPTVAVSIITAKRDRISNYSVLSAHKTMPEVLEALVADQNAVIDGLLLPGHVSAVIGAKPYERLAKRYGVRCVIAGFESVDILQAILMLVRQTRPKIEIQYKRAVGPLGSPAARKSIELVFERCPSVWRGIGKVSDSGLKIRKEFSDFDASIKFKIKVPPSRKHRSSCICGMVLKGLKTPLECRLFGKECSPKDPIGACMVSTEGACAAYYKYGR